MELQLEEIHKQFKIIDKKLVYLTNFPVSLKNKFILESDFLFGKYGEIIKLSVKKEKDKM